MIRDIIGIWKPGGPHSPGKHKVFFEGWYYKCVDREKKNSLIIIPGMFHNRNLNQSQAFIQIMDGDSHQATFHTFAAEEFRTSGTSFHIHIAGNTFSQNGLQIDIASEERTISGTLAFHNLTPWPVRLLSPGAMGWYAFMPFMQCYHGVLSMDHAIEGELTINGTTVSYSGGRGYIEKDWGYGFPSAYIWIQSNHFANPGTSLFVSVARIPWLRGAFRGFLAAFLHEGRLYRFTTYSGSTLESVEVSGKQVKLCIRDHHHRLEIEAMRTEGGWLYSPDGHSFKKNVLESLLSEVRVRFIEVEPATDNCIFEGTGYPTAMELNGELDQIVDRFV